MKDGKSVRHLPPAIAAPGLQLVPPDDLRLIVTTLMELLKARRSELDAYGPGVRRRYEVFACALRTSGFAFNETKDRQQRARDLRRLGELAAHGGNVAGAIACYELALRSWPAAGCRRALERLKRLDQ